jgi:hypothetical protein
MDSDLTQESTKKFVRRRNPWKYKTKEELERDNPSRADGLSPQKEAQWRRECFFLMQKAGMQLKMWVRVGKLMVCSQQNALVLDIVMTHLCSRCAAHCLQPTMGHLSCCHPVLPLLFSQVNEAE